MSGGFAPIRGTDSKDELLEERPISVRHQLSYQAMASIAETSLGIPSDGVKPVAVTIWQYRPN
jgi:hypothetical protein